MVFGVIVSLLLVATIFFAFQPALRLRNEGTADETISDFEHDLAVYRDQLKELEIEKDRGAILPEEANRARNEIARRLLATEAKNTTFISQAFTPKKKNTIFIGAVATLVVPAFVILLYGNIGSPNMPSQPLAARIEAAKQTEIALNQDNNQLRELVLRAEEHLKENPNDGRGWDVVAPIYFRLGDAKKARDAYEKAINILGEDARRLSALGEIEVITKGGSVTAKAIDNFQRAIVFDKNNGKSQFFLAVASAQAGDLQRGSEMLQALSENKNADQAWRALAKQQLAAISQNTTVKETLPEIKQPSIGAPKLDKETIDAAQNMSAADRQEMIVGMVSQLAGRLENEGGSIEEWIRLIRAHIVLKQTDKASAAAQRAYDFFADDEVKRRQIVQLSKQLNLPIKVQ